MEQFSNMKPGSLDGVTVLDFTWVLSGPTATRILTDMGATVIKVEPYKVGCNERYLALQKTHNGVTQSSFSINMNRGKKSICVNLKSAEGQKLLYELIEKTDVVVENFTPGVMDRLKLDYESVKKIKEDIIYCSISGFGHWGPYSSKPGYDPIAQAASGFSYQSKEPQLAPVAIGDHMAGYSAALAIISALFAKSVNGFGQNIDISMMDCLFSLLENPVPHRAISLAVGEDNTANKVGRFGGNFSPYGIFRGKDGLINITCLSDARYKPLVEVMGEKYAWMLTDPRTKDQHSRSVNPNLVNEAVDEWVMSQDSVAEVERLLEEADVPCMRIKSISELMDTDPQIKAREMITIVEQPFLGPMKMMGSPFKMSETPSCIRGYSPFLGEHNYQILADYLGYSDEQVKTMYENDILYHEPAVNQLQK